MLQRRLMISIDIRRRHRSRPPVVHRCKLRAILRREVFMLQLIRCRLEMVLVLRLHLHRRGTSRDPPAAVIAHVVVVDDRVLLNDGSVLVHTGHMHAAKISHGPVVRKGSAAPLAAKEAYSAITESIVNTTVKSYMRSPVARVPCIKTAGESPITRSPQYANSRRRHPHARNPVVARISIGPITGRPDITWSRQRRLHIYRQHRRGKSDRDKDAGVRLRNRQSQHGRHD